jgi:hypothetical protein
LSEIYGKSPWVLLFLVLGTSAEAQVDARADVQAAELRCASITDNRAWLDCYYGAAQPMRQLLGLAPAPVEQTRLVPPSGPASAVSATVKTQTASKGWFQSVFGSNRSPDSVVTARLDSYVFDQHRVFTVSLANGQVWRQLAEDDNRAHWHAPAIQYNVMIRPDGAGAFLLTLVGSDEHEVYKVRRVN